MTMIEVSENEAVSAAYKTISHFGDGIPDCWLPLVKTMAEYIISRSDNERAEAEERDKPVDDAWLSEMFPGPTESPNRVYYSWQAWQAGQVPCGGYVTTIRIIVDELDDTDATYMLETMTHEAGEEPTWSRGFGVHVQTRGQVVDLLRALGVETKKREKSGR